MNKRNYGQYCGLAHALDLIGERWSLLVIRELMTGPKRYKDLLKQLPGIGTNLLAKRLRFLEEQGILMRRTLPPPASTEAYDLTDFGRELEPVLIGLAQWGYQTIPRPGKDTVHFPDWSVLAMKAVFRTEKAAGVQDEYEYRIDEAVFHARIRDGQLTTGQGPVPYPDFVLETDGPTFLAIVSGELDAQEAQRQGRLTITGDMDAFVRSTELFDLAPLHQQREFKAFELTGRPGPDARKLQ